MESGNVSECIGLWMCVELREALNIVLFFCGIYFSNECYSETL